MSNIYSGASGADNVKSIDGILKLKEFDINAIVDPPEDGLYLYVKDDGNGNTVLKMKTPDGEESIVGSDNTQILTVADSAERKTLETYADGVVVGSTRVIQSDLPEVIWTVASADVTQDESWISQPLLDENGDLTGPIVLRESEPNDIPVDGEIVKVGNTISVGDGFSEQGAKQVSEMESKVFFANKMHQEIYFETRLDTSSATFPSLKTTTGYMTAQWWDGSTETYGFGIDSIGLTLSKTVPSSPDPFSGRCVKACRAWPSDVNGLPSGEWTDVTHFIGGQYTSAIDLGNVSAMGSFDNTSNSLLTSFNTEGLVNLGTLVIDSPYFKYISLKNLPSLTVLFLPNSLITSPPVIEVPTLEWLNLENCANVDYLKLDGLSNLNRLECSGANIGSITATGTSSAWVSDITLENNNMDTDAVYEFLNTLPVADSSTNITLAGNPCDNSGSLAEGVTYTAAETTALATSKNYVLVLV